MIDPAQELMGFKVPHAEVGVSLHVLGDKHPPTWLARDCHERHSDKRPHVDLVCINPPDKPTGRMNHTVERSEFTRGGVDALDSDQSRTSRISRFGHEHWAAPPTLLAACQLGEDYFAND